MRPDQAFSDLIGQIYDCALDPSLWPTVLGEITHAIGGTMADMVVSHPLEGAQSTTPPGETSSFRREFTLPLRPVER